jgi:signal transduction histidine kinase
MQGAKTGNGQNRDGGARRGSTLSLIAEIGFGVAALLGARMIHARPKREAEVRRQIAEEATVRERTRIARDLHDGLAQDLAFIAAHGDRLAVEMGAEHPLAVAARRALAVSRGAIAELSAPEASSAGEALRLVADELSTRFEIQVDVNADPRAAVASSDREDIVRIAREAIVNAARHGRARNVAVSLAGEEDQLVLRVRDDGVGIGSAPPSGGGFGFQSMRERTTTLGGRLSARAPMDGGTELELVMPA